MVTGILNVHDNMECAGKIRWGWCKREACGSQDIGPSVNLIGAGSSNTYMYGPGICVRYIM